MLLCCLYNVVYSADVFEVLQTKASWVKDILTCGAREHMLHSDSGIISLSSLVTWSVSWSSAHPPDPLLFTNQHPVRNSRMRSPAWSDQVSEPHYTTQRVMNDSVPLATLKLPCVCVCVTSLSRGLQQLCVGSKDRPVSRLGYNLLTARLTSH